MSECILCRTEISGQFYICDRCLLTELEKRLKCSSDEAADFNSHSRHRNNNSRTRMGFGEEVKPKEIPSRRRGRASWEETEDHTETEHVERKKTSARSRRTSWEETEDDTEIESEPMVPKETSGRRRGRTSWEETEDDTEIESESVVPRETSGRRRGRTSWKETEDDTEIESEPVVPKETSGRRKGRTSWEDLDKENIEDFDIKDSFAYIQPKSKFTKRD